MRREGWLPLTWRVRLLFALQPLAFGSWLPRIPDVQARFGLDPLALAIVLLAMPIGILLTLPFAGRLVTQIGSRNTLIYGFIFLTTIVALPLLASQVVWVFVSLLLLGAIISLFELGLNVLAGEVETNYQVAIMQSCHGFWSAGIAVGAGLGSLLLQYSVPGALAVELVGLVALGPALGLAFSLPHRLEREKGGAASSRRFGFKTQLPSPLLLGISFFTFGVTLAEGAVADWSAIYLRDVFKESGFMIGVGYTAFAVCMMIGRFLGDRARVRFGGRRLAGIGLLIALTGVALVAFATKPLAACVGFGLIGLGLSTGFPLAVSVAASLKDRPAPASIAILSFIGLAGFLVGPVLVGATISVLGFRGGIGILCVPLMLSLILSPLLATDQTKGV